MVVAGGRGTAGGGIRGPTLPEAETGRGRETAAAGGQNLLLPRESEGKRREVEKSSQRWQREGENRRFQRHRQLYVQSTGAEEARRQYSRQVKGAHMVHMVYVKVLYI